MDSKLSAAQKALPSLCISSLLFQHHLLALPSCLLQATTLIPVLPKHATFFPLPARYLPSLLIHLPCSRPAVLKVWSVDLSGSLRPFHGVCAVKNYFHNTTNTLFSLFTLLMFALVAQKPWWVKPLSWQISRQWRHSVVIVVVFHSVLAVYKTSQFHMKNTTDEAAEITHSIEIMSRSLRAHVIVPCSEIGSLQKAHLLHAESRGGSRESPWVSCKQH